MGCAGNTESVVVVPFAGGVPVAVGGTHVPGFVVPGAAAKNTARAEERSSFRLWALSPITEVHLQGRIKYPVLEYRMT
jgi:hypothetical protein